MIRLRTFSFRLFPAIALIAFASVAHSARADYAVAAADLESFMSLAPDTLTNFGNGPAIDGSGLLTSLLVQAGDTLTFKYNFLTDEVFDAGNTINDFAFFTVNGVATPFADVVTLPLVASSSGFASETGYQSFQFVFATGGPVLLGFGVTNVTDDTFDSALLIDAITLNTTLATNGGFETGHFTGFSTIGDAQIVGLYGSAPPEGSFQALLTTKSVPEPASLMMLSLGSAATLFRMRNRTKKAIA